MRKWPLVSIIFLLSSAFLPSPVIAVSLNTAPPAIKNAKPLFGARLKPVRVRIGVDYQPYAAVLFKNEMGKAYYKSVASGKRFHTLRTRLEQENQFYFNGLRVETVPVSWDKETRKYKIKLEFYKTYGLNGTLEDRLGSVLLTGHLEGKGRVLNFVGESTVSFNDTKGIRIAEFRVGTPKNKATQPRLSQYKTKKKAN